MCPEFTGSPERGWSQVVLRVSSLGHREKGGEKRHLLTTSRTNTTPVLPASLPANFASKTGCDGAHKAPDRPTHLMKKTLPSTQTP